MHINLSYIIATRNRLPFLRITIGRLISELQADEEIVVVDGQSTDGSDEYLQQLFEAGKIHQYLSEPDKNQAHGWNKAILMARGIVIKKIIDDDVPGYKSIRACKAYMLSNSTVDVVISNDLSSIMANHMQVQKHSRLAQYHQWKAGSTRSFTFGDVHMLIRRASLSNLGLYNTDFVMIDYEYALRISHLQANIVYYTGYNALTVGHPQTVTSKRHLRSIRSQGKRANYFYEYAGDAAQISLWSKIKIAIGKLIYAKASDPATDQTDIDLETIYAYYYDHIDRTAETEPGHFIEKV